MIVSILLIILICIIVSYFVLNYQRQQSSVNILPGPKALPFIGNAHTLLKHNLDEILNVFTKLAEEYPSPFRLWLGNKLFIFVYEPDQIKAVLQSSHSLNKSIIYEFFQPLFGSGIFVAPASSWYRQRKMIIPTFSNNMLRGFFDIFVEESLIFTDELEEIRLHESEIILFKYMWKRILNIACYTLMGNKLESLVTDQCFEITTRLKKLFTYRLRNIYLHPNFIFNLTATKREVQKNLDFLHSLVDKIVQQACALNKLNSKSKCKTNKTIFDILMDATQKGKITQDDLMKIIYNNTFSIIFAAGDTTSLTLNFVIFMLANFPEIQEKVYKELWEIYKAETPKSAPIKYEDLQHMDYLERVIKETMRIFPVAPIIARQLTADLKIGEVILPKSSNVVIQLITAQQNKKYWPNPLVFDPDRFLPEKIGSSNLSFMPFSLGPRNCIGIRYAMISMKVILATLIRTFVFKVDNSVQIDKIKLQFDFMLDTAKPLKIKIEKRGLQGNLA